jgi:SARP family transcriptional regulator, regulator of embCAB operon
MEIRVLGTVAVAKGTRFVEIPAHKVRALLAVVALHVGQTVSCTTLADELWSDQPPPKMRNALQAAVTRARRVMGEATGCPMSRSPLRSVHNGYVLDLTPEAIDCVRFQQLAAEGHAILPSCPGHALELFEDAMSLWRGPALLDAGDGLLCRSAAARFDEMRLSLWEDIASARIRMQDGRLILGSLRELTEQYPLRERFSELLMIALYRSGHQGDALEVYHKLRNRLDEEIGLEPRPFLRRRYEEILAQDTRLMEADVVTRWKDDFHEVR